MTFRSIELFGLLKWVNLHGWEKYWSSDYGLSIIIFVLLHLVFLILLSEFYYILGPLNEFKKLQNVTFRMTENRFINNKHLG